MWKFFVLLAASEQQKNDLLLVLLHFNPFFELNPGNPDYLDHWNEANKSFTSADIFKQNDVDSENVWFITEIRRRES